MVLMGNVTTALQIHSPLMVQTPQHEFFFTDFVTKDASDFAYLAIVSNTMLLKWYLCAAFC